MTRVASVPLVVHDPYFSLWSPADRLYDCEIKNWYGQAKPMRGVVLIDGKAFRFMGGPQSESEETLTQADLLITPTRTVYTFEGAGVRLVAAFASPLLLYDLELVSRPCTYMDFQASSTDGKPHDVTVRLTFDERICHDSDEHEGMSGYTGIVNDMQYAWMGKAKQSPLNHSGDHISIDWGYLYLSAPKDESIRLCYKADGSAYAALHAEISFGSVMDIQDKYIVTAYDDTLSIMYFDNAMKAYWARNNKTIRQAMQESIEEHDSLLKRCEVFDEALCQEASEKAGDEYALLCALAYRQSIAAHKLIADENGELIFLSKECDSNGCIGTVDVSYPSVPLYLLYNPELVKAMLRPVFRFASLPVWDFDFAPHDVGRYPYATGQVYGLSESIRKSLQFTNGDVCPPLYPYPAGSGLYNLKYQMPVEECGNMLIMSAMVSLLDGNADFVTPYMGLLDTWAHYLITHGQDPNEQLCTDDFAGHSAHNANLSVKAIMGIAAYAILLEKAGRAKEAEGYFAKAAQMAKTWESMAVNDAEDHTTLSLQSKEGWSLKYNMVWDLIFQTNLFSEKVIANEIQWYIRMQNKYGVPLDNRASYTKSDWILWCAAMAQSKEDMASLIRPVYRCQRESASRVPFSDWYETESGKCVQFMNRTVQGGIFMPLLVSRI